MLARVAIWEGGSAEAIRAAGEEINSRMQTGPPEGVKSSGLTMLVDPEGGRTMMIGLFESEEDLRSSETTLQAMNPPEGLGRRIATDIYMVAAEVRA